MEFLHTACNATLIDRVTDYIGKQLTQNAREDVFVDWLAEKLKEEGCNVYLQLESKKGSSKYGLF